MKMKKHAKKLVLLAIITFALAIAFKLGAIVVAPVYASTLMKATNTILLFAIAMALV